ncbi:hypothetical protein KY290_031157 [Solanum tuberosum]|uniref:Reverse transcriptase domain-containing protein n=1 Tax=Solanum tuberosum TaxID=4113 RepID=A0ABQ7UA82_SOLTU|nr:hypothetical protein KY290_031157 [Solanum tuberosum]
MLELADHSIARSDGVIDDVLFQVGTIIFPKDFVILDFEPDLEVLFILGHPFLTTGGALINVAVSRMTMRAHDKVEVFDMYKAMKLPTIYEELLAITIIDEETTTTYVEAQDPLERVLIGQDIDGDVEAQELASILDVPNVSMLRKDVEPLNIVLGPPPKPSTEEALKLELKTFPCHHKYAFLGSNETLPIAKIHAIRPALCMHMIFMEEGDTSSAQPQRRLNPLMKDVVNKEVIKWLDAGIVYPFSDSKWVNPVQCLAKKEA